MPATDDSTPPGPSQPLRLMLGVAVAVQVLRLWRSWCVFPWWQWNEIRLEPAFQFVHGGVPYPFSSDAPVGTWIYGPLSLLLLAPATLASSAAGALLVAGALTTAITLIALWLVARFWPAETGEASATTRLLTLLVCVALWPRSAFEYIQADNAAIALGLVGNLALVRSERPAGRWLAALAVAAALFSKQTAVTLAAAQLVWLARREGIAAGLAHAARVAAGVAALLALFGAMFGARGLWLNAVEIPAHIPWVSHPFARLQEMGPWLIADVGVAAAVVIGWRRRFLDRHAALSLATWSWLLALPLDVASSLKLGGSSNAFQGVLYLLPPAILAIATAFERCRRGRLLITLVAAPAALGLAGFAFTWNRPWAPATTHLRQADQFAAQLPGQIWFPWNPLVTFYRDHRFYHAEDGLYVRAIARRPLSPAAVRAGLPPRWSVTALATQSADWGLARQLAPTGAREDRLGLWTLQSWAPVP